MSVQAQPTTTTCPLPIRAAAVRKRIVRIADLTPEQQDGLKEFIPEDELALYRSRPETTIWGQSVPVGANAKPLSEKKLQAAIIDLKAGMPGFDVAGKYKIYCADVFKLAELYSPHWPDQRWKFWSCDWTQIGSDLMAGVSVEQISKVHHVPDYAVAHYHRYLIRMLADEECLQLEDRDW